jgi:hypothetical protein
MSSRSAGARNFGPSPVTFTVVPSLVQLAPSISMARNVLRQSSLIRKFVIVESPEEIPERIAAR